MHSDTRPRPDPTIVERAERTDPPAIGPDRGSPRPPAGRSRRRWGRAAAIALAAGLVAGAVPAGGAVHVVVAGETLSGIANGYGVGLRELARHNDISDVDHIVVGQVLVLPEDAVRGATTHRVAAGDTLGGIAAAYGVTLAALVEANSIANPNLIVVGTSLAIPGPGGRTATPGGVEHAVEAGETLALIAARYGVTVRALAEANGITEPDLIVIGTVLAVGADPRSEPAEPDPEPPARTHSVAPGDTLAAIAAAYGVTVEALAEANGISDHDVVVIGTVLTVPDAAATPDARPEASPDPDQADPDEPGPDEPGPDERGPGGTDVARRLDFWASEYDVPSDLLKALTWFESGWNNRLVSEAGAIGIGQLMPTTVEFVSRYLIGEPIDPTVPDQNIQASARFLRYLLEQTDHRPSQAVAAYYQGLTSLRRDGVFESSRFYVDGILALRSRF